MASFPVADFTPLKVLGSGASGDVVLARHDPTGTPVAMKFLAPELAADPDFRARFEGEAQLLMNVDNPHITQLYEYIDTTDGPVIVMEAVNGVSLRELICEGEPMAPQAALAVMKGSLLGLAAAHERGVVHRDYKPQNVLVQDNGVSKLLDFGVAVPSGVVAGVAGTPAYMAPEQWAGAPSSPATDVYAATATFYYCLTGAMPYGETTVDGLEQAHISAPIPVDSVPEPVRGLIAAGLAKNPADRPATALAFVDELERAAVAGYGAEWESHGVRQLAGLATGAALLLPLGASLAPALWTSALTVLGVAVPTKVVAAAAALTVSGAVVVGAAQSGPTTSTGTTFAARESTTLGPTPGPSQTPVAVGPTTVSTSARPSASASAKPTATKSAAATPTTSATTTAATTPPGSATTTARRSTTSRSVAPPPPPPPPPTTSTPPPPPSSVQVVSISKPLLTSPVNTNTPSMTSTVTTNAPGPVTVTVQGQYQHSSGKNLPWSRSAASTITLVNCQTGCSVSYTFSQLPSGNYCDYQLKLQAVAGGATVLSGNEAVRC